MASNAPNQGYCGNLGHRTDDESALVYMRARYCEPSTGRFVSEDPGKNSTNWFLYCSDNPVNRVDSSGKWDAADFKDLALVLMGMYTSKLFMTTGVSMIASGLLVAVSPCTWFLTLVFAIGCVGNAYSAGVDVLNSALKDGGYVGKYVLTSTGKGREFRVGIATECIAYITATYAMYDFLYRHLESAVAGTDR